MTVEQDARDGWVAPSGELDLATAPILERALASVTAQRVIVDLRGLTFTDCAAIRLLILLDADLRAKGRDLAVVQGIPPVQRVFRLTGMVERFTWVEPPRPRRFARDPRD